MKSPRPKRETPMNKYAQGVLSMSLAFASCTGLVAQTGTVASAVTETVKTFYLTNITQPNDATETVTALRNLLDASDKVFLVPSQNAVIVRATPEQLTLAQKLLTDLDRLKKTYRLTYTIAESEGGKRIGVQHFTMIVVSGGRTTLKQGSKVPVVTGSYSTGTNGTQTQMTYLDIGMNFDASLDEFVDGVRLRTKVEQSSISEEKSSVGAQDPIVRQTVLEGTSILAQGKSLMLGSIDIPGSTRHLEIEVMLEAVR
jgi:type II secretory pathway component GspD/PulD (secretin)